MSLRNILVIIGLFLLYKNWDTVKEMCMGKGSKSSVKEDDTDATPVK